MFRILVLFLFFVLISCSNKSVKKILGENCKRDECEKGLVCEDSSCRVIRVEENGACKKDNDCLKELACVRDRCIKESGVGENCSDNKRCKNQLDCYENICYDFSRNSFDNIKMLDFASVFKFYVMSDNKSDAIKDNYFKKMIDWTKDRDMKFVIGLGDHLKKGRGQDFIDFIQNDDFYKNSFYPNIADGENEYYGSGQDDWGSGKKLFDEIDFTNKKNVTMRENGVEYYAYLNIEGFNIHIIQLHFPDQPEDVNISWPKESREYLIKKLKSIDKKDNDIVIVGAHSKDGSWNNFLTKEQLAIVMDKVDIGFSATIHLYERITISGNENSGTLFLNTGSITHGTFDTNGYLELHILKNPNRIVVQYIDVYKDNLKYNIESAWIKYINGKIEKIR